MNSDEAKLKRFKSDSDNNNMSSFEAELAEMEKQETNCVRRRSLPTIDCDKDSVVFQQIQIDHYFEQTSTGDVPVFRMYGVTMAENSVCAYVYGFTPTRVYKSADDLNHHFMAKRNIVACCWIELPPGTWDIRHDPASRCQLEVYISCDKLISYEPKGEWTKVAPLRVLSIDIECAVRPNIFPEAQHDSVIQIANMVTKHGEAEFFVRKIFTLNTCAPIAGAEISSFSTETEMLEAWKTFALQLDPDIITGYYINNFDLPYLLNRASHLKIGNFEYLGRIENIPSVVTGPKMKKYVNLPGRVPFDMWFLMARIIKPNIPTYKLNDVSFHYLGERKEVIDYHQITEMQNDSDLTRRTLAVYCLKDALLPLRLMYRCSSIPYCIKRARVSRIQLAELLREKFTQSELQLLQRSAGCCRSPCSNS